MKRIRALVVDDEKWARRRIVSLLAEEPDFQVGGECADGEEAVNAISAEPPDVLFLDIQMPEMDGFEVLEAVGPGRVPVVVFVTAYDQYAIRAFEIHAADYLVKPFEAERFKQTLDRVRQEVSRRTLPDERRLEGLLLAMSSRRPYLKRFACRTGGRIVFIKVEDVTWIEATGNYVSLHAGKETHLVRETMNGLEPKLDPEQFIRIHRSTIVSLDRVQSLQPWFQGELVLLLTDGTRLTVGRSFRSRLKHIVQNSVEDDAPASG